MNFCANSKVSFKVLYRVFHVHDPLLQPGAQATHTENMSICFIALTFEGAKVQTNHNWINRMFSKSILIKSCVQIFHMFSIFHRNCPRNSAIFLSINIFILFQIFTEIVLWTQLFFAVNDSFLYTLQKYSLTSHLLILASEIWNSHHQKQNNLFWSKFLGVFRSQP